MKYIAYGSNMSPEQMTMHCPRSVLIGTGYLHGARLDFYVHATVEFTGNDNDRVPVAVWELNSADVRSLDRYEGYPDYYAKLIRTVTMKDGSQITGMLYVMNPSMKIETIPESRYFCGIEDAYHALGFETEIDSVLEPALERIVMKDPSEI